MLPKMSGKFSIWTQLKLIAGAALLLLAILIFGVVLPNHDQLQSPENTLDLQQNLQNLNISLILQKTQNSSQQQQQLIILSNTSDPVNEQRKDAVLQMIHSLWKTVVEEEEDKESSTSFSDNPETPSKILEFEKRQNRHRTLTLSLSTLWVAGLQEEFNRTWNLLQDSKYLDLPQKLDLKVSETVTDILGSLLSCHALTGKAQFIETAQLVANTLEPAYDNRTGISYPTLSTVSSSTFDFDSDSGLVSSLSEVGGQSLEYLALASNLQKSSKTSAELLLKTRVQLVLSNLNSSKTVEGFYADRLFVPSGIWASSAVTAYQSTKLFYSSLIKSTILISGSKNSSNILKMFTDAVDSLLMLNFSSSPSLIGTSKTGLKFTREFDHSLRAFTEMTCMSSEGCYLGAMLALGAQELLNQKKESSSVEVELSTQSSMLDDSLETATESSADDDNQIDPETSFKAKSWNRLAQELTETCYQAALRNEKNRLLPDRFCFDDLNEATNRGGGINSWEDQEFSKDNEMRPDLAESYFVLWRMTGDEQYRAKAWQMAQAIQKYLKRRRRRYSKFEALASYQQDSLRSSGVVSSLPSPTTTRNLLGATLKYLYLVFADPETSLPLERWVFNAAGQPLPKVNFVVRNLEQK